MHSDVSRRWIWCNSIAPAVQTQYLYRPTAWRSTDKTNRRNEQSSQPTDQTNLTRQILFTHTPSYYLKSHFNIILPSTPKRSQWSIYRNFPPFTLHVPLLTHPAVPRAPPTSSWFDHQKITLKSRSIRRGLRRWFPRRITSSWHPLPPPYSVQVSSSTPYDRTRSACSSSMWAPVSLPHKTGKFIVPYFIKFVTFDRKGAILLNGRSIPSVQYVLSFFTNDSLSIELI